LNLYPSFHGQNDQIEGRDGIQEVYVGTVLYFNRSTENQEEKGSIRRKTGSKKLYVDFYYFGKRVLKTTGLDDNPSNYAKVRDWLDRNMEKIANGTFVFAKAFPGASQEEKQFFAQKEGWNYSLEPRQILFGDYVEKWMKEIWSTFRPEGKGRDFKQAIDYWLLPYFGGKTFHQITGVEVKKFLAGLRWRDGKNKGQPLSRSRVKNILIPMRSIWNDACDENHWELPDPFRNIKKQMPKKVKKAPTIFRFEEWMKLIDNIDPFYKDVAEVMIMTGMIGSEIAGLKKDHISDGCIHVQDSIVRRVERVGLLKTDYRQREIPITNALRERLDRAIKNSNGSYIFSMKGGEPFNINSFRKTPWSRALEKAEVRYRNTYATRHSFAEWCLVGGIHPERLIRLLGHGSKQMVYEVYGKYVDGIEADTGQIREYFGNAFFGLSKTKTSSFPSSFGESHGESLRSLHATI
jgi:integrase